MTHAATIDFDKYRLRSFVERLIELGEVEIHDKPVPLTGLSPIIERTDKAVLFKKAGPEQVELVAKTAGNRKRLAAAFETSEDKLYDEYFRGSPARSRWSRCRPATRRCTTSRSPARTSISPSCRSIRSTPMTAAATAHRPSTTPSIRRPAGAMSAAAA